MKIAVRLRQGDLGWLGLAAGIVAYELAADDGELLSEAVDRYLVKQPLLTTAMVCLTAAHLLNMIPERYDPFAVGFTVVRATRPRTREPQAPQLRLVEPLRVPA